MALRDEKYWIERAQQMQKRLAPGDYTAFVDWLSKDHAMIPVYERSIDATMVLWNEHQGYLRLPEGM